MLTHSEQAKRAFLDSVCEIPGVCVQLVGGQTLGEQTIRVRVPDILGETASRVYDAEIGVRKRFRKARLDLQIDEADRFDDTADSDDGIGN